ncbi:predicted protein [Chaetomium globosum CBS 148.51]|uniref:Uncharacterized protein n=1 Tax=Chaetomium globosum (strain ATCC 6205 / CBS 148.51 / DSM 1962 / NBRC 6347 / NRRL 1970) TaxID=306901 RepID=Q2HAT5_CHAGB|nr:uncharacterized protein CHGG_02669 [Chaetomium globosum CBS 148.51]EAQ90734.1 predicted protein [Chaetomium globosum CBS 148.51]
MYQSSMGFAVEERTSVNGPRSTLGNALPSFSQPLNDGSTTPGSAAPAPSPRDSDVGPQFFLELINFAIAS